MLTLIGAVLIALAILVFVELLTSPHDPPWAT